jgi:hypothetical protein
MKTFSYLIALAVFSFTASSFAGNFVQGLPDGSYRGKFRGQDKGGINFLVKSYPGCDGCFIAYKLNTPDFIGSKHVQLVAYNALPMEEIQAGNGQVTSARYSLTPIGINTVGKLTLPNEDPSLVLTIRSGLGTKDAEFTVTSAQSGNNLGGVESMVYLWSRESPFDIVDPSAGGYRESGKIKEIASVGVVGQNRVDQSHSARISFYGLGRREGGDFILKEKIPYTYTFNAVSYHADGSQVKKMPMFIVMFVEKHGQRWMLMVNPVQSEDVTRLILK